MSDDDRCACPPISLADALKSSLVAATTNTLPDSLERQNRDLPCAGDISERARQLVGEWEASQLLYDDASAFADAQPEWLLGAVTLLREVARG
jgi:hypothetical protein